MPNVSLEQEPENTIETTTNVFIQEYLTQGMSQDPTPESEKEVLVRNPQLKLEHVRYVDSAFDNTGRGSGTASLRGYHTERLLAGILTEEAEVHRRNNCDRIMEYYDRKKETADSDTEILTEAKSCVDRYPSGSYGRFKIWEDHHQRLLDTSAYHNTIPLYFFLVYKPGPSPDEMSSYKYSDKSLMSFETELGKLIVDAENVDAVIDDDDWNTVNHDTMGWRGRRAISWNHLLNKLDVDKERFLESDIVIKSDHISSKIGEGDPESGSLGRYLNGVNIPDYYKNGVKEFYQQADEKR
jgi:hypothetical protein